MNPQTLKEKLMLNKTPLLIVFLVVATVLLVGLALSTNKGSNPLPQKLTEDVSGPETSLIMSDVYGAEEASASALKSFSTDVEILTGDNKVTAVQLEIKYNPALLTNVTVLPGDFFQNPIILLEKIDTEEGIISYALGTDANGISGEGVVATISFNERLNARGNTSFELLSKTAVSAEDEEESVLRETSGVEFTLSGSANTSPSAQTSQ